MSLAALIVAIFAVILAAGSLGWQVYQHRLTGPRLRVELRRGWLGAPQPEGDPVLMALIINTGRQAATTTSVRLTDTEGRFFQEWISHTGGFPHTVEPHSSASVAFDLTTTERFFVGRGESKSIRVRAVFSLATGRDLHSDWLSL